MKAVISASCIFILIIILIFTSYVYSDRVTHELLISLDKNEKFVAESDWENVKNETSNFVQMWTSYRDTLAAFVNHADISDIECSISRLSAAAKLHNTTDFFEEIGTTRMMILNIKELQKINFANLF